MFSQEFYMGLLEVISLQTVMSVEVRLPISGSSDTMQNRDQY